MAVVKTSIKPGNKIRQRVDCASAIPDGASIESCSVLAKCIDDGSDASAEILDGASAEVVNGKTVIYLVKAGKPGHHYNVTMGLELSTGERIEEDLEVQVEGPRPVMEKAAVLVGAGATTEPVEKIAQNYGGQIVKPGRGVPRAAFQLRAFGYGPGDKRHVPSRVSGLEYAAVPPGDYEEAGVKNIPLASIAISKKSLMRGKLSSASAALSGGVKATGEGISPIRVVERTDKPGKYVAMAGSHRVASLALDKKPGDVPVMLMRPKSVQPIAQKGASMSTKTKEKAALDKAADPEMGLSLNELRDECAEGVRESWGGDYGIVDVFPETQYLIVRYWGSTYGGSPGSKIMHPMYAACGIEADYYRLPYEMSADGEGCAMGDPEPMTQIYAPLTKSVEKYEVEFLAKRIADGLFAIIPDDAEEIDALRDSIVESKLAKEIIRIKDASSGAPGLGLRMAKDVAGDSFKIKLTAYEIGEEETKPEPGTPEAAIAAADKRLLDGEFFAESLAKSEKGIVYNVVYELQDPKAPGFKPDLQGEFTDDPDVIEDAAHEYLAKSRIVKRQHKGAATDDRVVESWLQKETGKIGTKLVKKGSWVIGIKMGPKSKELYKAGKLKGVSMGGRKVVEG